MPAVGSLMRLQLIRLQLMMALRPRLRARCVRIPGHGTSAFAVTVVSTFAVTVATFCALTVSTFAVTSGRAERDPAELPSGVDPARMEQAMAGLAREAEGVADDDPKAMAGLMRRFYEGTGTAMGEGMSEALRRFEAGEDPETIEAEMGEALEAEDPFEGHGPSLRRLGHRSRPAVDPELYEL